MSRAASQRASPVRGGWDQRACEHVRVHTRECCVWAGGSEWVWVGGGRVSARVKSKRALAHLPAAAKGEVEEDTPLGRVVAASTVQQARVDDVRVARVQHANVARLLAEQGRSLAPAIIPLVEALVRFCGMGPRYDAGRAHRLVDVLHGCGAQVRRRPSTCVYTPSYVCTLGGTPAVRQPAMKISREGNLGIQGGPAAAAGRMSASQTRQLARPPLATCCASHTSRL